MHIICIAFQCSSLGHHLVVFHMRLTASLKIMSTQRCIFICDKVQDRQAVSTQIYDPRAWHFTHKPQMRRHTASRCTQHVMKHMLTTTSILMYHAAWISWTACHGWTHSETHHSSACCHCCLVMHLHLLPHPQQLLLLSSAHCQHFAVVAVAAAASAVLPATPLQQVKLSNI